MKFPHSLRTLAAAFFLLPVLALAATFEGKLTMKMTDARGTAQVINFSLKDGLQRLDLNADGMAIASIINFPQHEMTILMPAQSMYMVQKLPEIGLVAGGQGGTAGDVALEKTTATEKILGYDCVKYLAKGKGATTELWVTDQLGQFLGMGSGPMGGGRGGPSGWEKALMGKDFFPLRVIETGSNGKVRTRLDVTAIEKQPLPAALFAAPAGWQKLDLPGMMPGLLPRGT